MRPVKKKSTKFAQKPKQSSIKTRLARTKIFVIIFLIFIRETIAKKYNNTIISDIVKYNNDKSIWYMEKMIKIVYNIRLCQRL